MTNQDLCTNEVFRTAYTKNGDTISRNRNSYTMQENRHYGGFFFVRKCHFRYFSGGTMAVRSSMIGIKFHLSFHSATASLIIHKNTSH